jgi:epoxyqueuosine reductase
MGNRIFGCDICQEVCPWNRRHSSPTSEPGFQPDSDTLAPHLVDLLSLDAEGFRLRFGDSAIARAKRRGLLRNVAVALGNWGHLDTIAPLTTALRDNEPLVRGHAAWALGQTMSTQAQSTLVQALSSETDLWVREEIAQGLEALNRGLSHS